MRISSILGALVASMIFANITLASNATDTELRLYGLAMLTSSVLSSDGHRPETKIYIRNEFCAQTPVLWQKAIAEGIDRKPGMVHVRNLAARLDCPLPLPREA